jgi:hypothetical protein
LDQRNLVSLGCAGRCTGTSPTRHVCAWRREEGWAEERRGAEGAEEPAGVCIVA